MSFSGMQPESSRKAKTEATVQKENERDYHLPLLEGTPSGIPYEHMFIVMVLKSIRLTTLGCQPT